MVWAALFLGACGDPGTGDSGPHTQPANVAGDYIGIFPCDNCPGIRTSLRLLADGHYFLEQVYLGDETAPDSAAASVGRWRLAPHDVIVLRGAGPERSFDRDGADTLRMQTGSELEYVLERSTTRPPLNSTLGLSGDLKRGSGSLFLTDCRTGVSLPIAAGGDYPRIIRQLRKIGSGQRLFAELEGRIAWSAAGQPTSVHVVRLGTLRADKTCR